MQTKHPFPKYDLGSAIEAASIIRGKAADGRTANMGELAVFLGYKSTNNGAFLNRVAAMRAFGLLEGRADANRLTDRALNILAPDLPQTAQRARLDAFFGIRLYKDFFERYGGAHQDLPDASGMQNGLVHHFGIDEKQANLALARLLTSADEAGLFKVAGNRAKMIRPTLRLADDADGETPGPTGPTGPTQRSGMTTGIVGPSALADVRHSKIIDGVLDLLPTTPEWTEAELQDWLKFFESALRLVYKVPTQGGG